MDRKDEEDQKYIQTWLKNRYIEFFLMLMNNTEPNEINATMAINTMLKFRYGATNDTLYTTGKMIEDNTASEAKRGLYFKIKGLKKYAMVYNANLLKNFDNIYNLHDEMSTPFAGILYHLFCYLKYDIKTYNDDHNFAKMVNYIYTRDKTIIETQLQDILLKKTPTHTQSRVQSKAKSKWVNRCIENGYVLNKRKYNLFPDQSKTGDKK